MSNDLYPTPEEMARRTVLEKQHETKRAARGRGGLQTGQSARSATVVRLARRLGKTVDDLLSRIPPDTARRLKYPTFEQEQEDGSILFVHPVVKQDKE